MTKFSISIVSIILMVSIMGCLKSEPEPQQNRYSTVESPLQMYCGIDVIGAGQVDIETDYLPQVLRCEAAVSAGLEALKALAIAARSVAYYKIVNGGIPVAGDESVQVYNCGKAPAQKHIDAIKATTGRVLRYKGVQVYGFYMAGAIPSTSNCVPVAGDNDWSNTEKHVTYNWGKTGNNIDKAVDPIGSPGNPGNRGVLSQNGSACLGNNGWKANNILRFYYGADIEITTAPGKCDGAVWQSICEAKAVSGATGIFKDYPDNLTGQKEAEALLAAGITKGCATNYFCPNCVTTRAMAITFLLRAANIDVGNPPANPSFSDLQAGAYYVPYVEKAKELGIVGGYADGTFKPDAPTKRSEFAKMIVKTLTVPTVNPATASFTDVPKSHWAYKYVETLKALCITQGTSATTFSPEDSLPRWQAGIFIVRAFDLLGKNDCVSYCDEASCETASYCDPWQSCKFSSQCVESGTQKRSCHDFACAGAVAQASCNESASNQTQSCVQDTDGNVVVGWGSWSTCTQKEVCSTTGTKTRTRTVCKAGKQSTETQKKDCAFNLDPNKCNDGKACTVDVCKVGTGCVNTPQNTHCDDGNVCTKNVCKANKGCVTTNQDGASCDDGNACTESDLCAAAKCSGKALSCNDDNACTADSCDPKMGCLNTAVSCDDQNACTVDSCDSKTGCANTPKNCDDSDLCTQDACAADTGECANTAIENCCVADEDCTAEGDCVTPMCDLNENQCTTEAVADCCVEDDECNDDNACTTDSCADNNECENTEILGCCLADLDCSDDNACTADSCADNNECENTEISDCCLKDSDCHDDNACTVDSCTENQCVSKVIAGCCTGKGDCSDSENCVNGACMEAVATDSGTEGGTTDGSTTDGSTTDGSTTADTGDDEGADDEGATDLSDDGGGDTSVDAIGSGSDSGDTGSNNNNPGSESSGCVAAPAPSSSGQPMAFLMLLFSLWILRRRNASEPA